MLQARTQCLVETAAKAPTPNPENISDDVLMLATIDPHQALLQKSLQPVVGEDFGHKLLHEREQTRLCGLQREEWEMSNKTAQLYRERVDSADPLNGRESYAQRVAPSAPDSSVASRNLVDSALVDAATSLRGGSVANELVRALRADQQHVPDSTWIARQQMERHLAADLQLCSREGNVVGLIQAVKQVAPA